MAGGLAALLSKSSPKGEDEEMEEDKETDEAEETESGLADEYLADAFAALKSDDKDGFIEAMKAFSDC